MLIFRIAACVLFSQFFAQNVLSQTQPDGRDLIGEVERLESIVERQREALTTLGEKLAVARQSVNAVTGEQLNTIRQDYVSAKQQEYKFLVDIRTHAANVLQWQLISSYILLFVVSAISLGGISLAWFEVRYSLISDRLAGEQQATNSESNVGTTNSVELTPASVKITSAVSGIVILALSLGFLFLFVERVFTIEPLRLGEFDTNAPQSD